MNIELYYMKQTRSVRPRWLLEELKLPYTLHNIDLFAGEGESAEYLQINPLGAVPSIRIDDNVMLESAAICHWLADAYLEKGFAPALDTPARMKYEQWMSYSQATLEVQPSLILLHSQILPEAQRVSDIIPWASTRQEKILKILNKELSHGGYLLGDDFSAADIMVGTTLMMQSKVVESFSSLNAYVQKLKQRPAYLAATQ